MTSFTAPARIQVRVNELNQLFNSMDPSPFLERDLDADAEEFIVGWAQDLPHDRPLELVIDVTRLPATLDCAAAEGYVREAMHNYFDHREAHSRREFSKLMRIGRKSLIIGIAFLAACLLISRLLGSEHTFGALVSESLIIVGWVALWRPLEIFLYDWWPLAAECRLYRRLSAAAVSVNVREGAAAAAPVLPAAIAAPVRPATA